jgi:hypothetical protein
MRYVDEFRRRMRASLLALATPCVLVALATPATAQTTLFTSSFGTANNNNVGVSDPNWSDDDGGGSDCQVTNGTARAGSASTQHARLREDCGITSDATSPVCFGSVELRYFWRGDGDSENSEDSLIVQVSYDGGAFTTVNEHPSDNSTWSSEVSVALSPPAGTTSVRVRFIGNTDQTNEQIRLDDVRLLATAASAGTACGSSSDTDCSNPDTCDGNGACLSNDEAAGTACPDDGEACTADACDGGGTCTHPAGNAGTTCRADAGECDVGETCDGTTPTCPIDALEPAGTACGDGGDTDCTDPDSCDGSGTCLPNHEGAGTACADDGEACTTDACDGGGTCDHPAGNAGTTCRADGGDCDVAETCDGTTPSCPPDAFEASGTTCGDTADTDCTDPDTCDAGGACQPNDAASGAACADDGEACTTDTCDGGGTCDHPAGNAGTTCRADAGGCDVAEICDGTTPSCPPDAFETSGTPCGDTADTDCTDPDTCDAGGACQPNNAASGAACADDGEACTTDTCDSGGSCTHPAGNAGTTCRAEAGACDVVETCDGTTPSCPADAFEAAGTGCGDAADTSCTEPDTCDGAGTCQPNHAASGVTCGDGADTDCSDPDTCDGSGGCSANDQPAATPCGDTTDTECTDPDSCDGAGSCSPNHAAAGAACPNDGEACTADACDGSGTCTHPASNAGTECRASAGLCDVAESCDGTSPACPDDSRQPSTTVCRPADGPCDAAETCDGEGAACPVDAAEPDGTECDDGDTCTAGDTCSNGTCGSEATPCGDGTLQEACSEQCDDGNTVAGDGCSPTCRREMGCEAGPQTGCRRAVIAGRGKLAIRNRTDESRKKLKWIWTAGAATTKGDFGSPLGDTDYEVCIYDGQSTMVSSATAPAGGTCAGQPCWKETATGFRYRDREMTPDGIVRLRLKVGGDGKARVILRSRGRFLHLPPLPASQPLTVQLKNANGVCWEGIFISPATKNDILNFTDKSN